MNARSLACTLPLLVLAGCGGTSETTSTTTTTSTTPAAH